MSFDTTINKSLSVARSKEYNPQNLLFFFGIRFFVVSLSLSARLAFAFALSGDAIIIILRNITMCAQVKKSEEKLKNSSFSSFG